MPQQYQDPIASVIDGLLQGHAIATSIHRQKQQDEAFARHNALQDQESSIQDIMNQMHLEQNARPVQNGTVTMPGLDVPAEMPGSQAPGLVRKADPSRTVKYKNSRESSGITSCTRPKNRISAPTSTRSRRSARA
jgi:hypothetical protein